MGGAVLVAMSTRDGGGGGGMISAKYRLVYKWEYGLL